MNKIKIHIFKKQLNNLYNNKKLSVYKIAEKFNCSSQAIFNRLKKYDIKTRTLSEALKGNKCCGVGKNHHKWKPEKHKIYYCIEKCGREIKYNTWKKGLGRCQRCASSKRPPTYPMLGKKHSEESKRKMRTTPVKHHVYLKENSDKIILLTRKKHTLLHQRIFEYIMKKHGKKEIDKYLKWFDKKYKLR